MSQFYSQEKPSITSIFILHCLKAQGLMRMLCIFFISFLFISNSANAQLGIYEFKQPGPPPPPPGTCPANPNVTAQPANAVFSTFSTVNTTCKADPNAFKSEDWNENGTIDLNEYNQFTITADVNFLLNLTNLSFSQEVDKKGSGSGNGNTAWILRSSLNNYSTNIATGSSYDQSQTPSINLPTGFSGITSVTFRLYLINAKDDKVKWMIDDIALDGSVTIAATPPADPGNPSSDAPQCANPGVTLTANGTAPAGETWYWQTTATGTSTANAGATNLVTSSGTYYIRSQDNTTSAWSSGAGSITVTVTPNVGTPVFSLGAASIRCDGAGTVTYTATASNSTNITYSLDATSSGAGNTIDASTGAVTYVAGWTGLSTITASADGCAGPKTANHIVTTNTSVGTPVFALGSSSTRCQGTPPSTLYTATAANATGITYSLDAASLSGGNSINAATGSVNFAPGWNGTSIITATATGCGGSTTATHTVTVTGNVAVPIFTGGPTSTRCQGAGAVTYTANATNATSITYTLNAPSLSAGNTIDASTGEVTYVGGYAGTSIITATATGCGAPRTANHTVTVTPGVATPSFSSGATSSRCQAGGSVTYTASAANNTGITYSLDAASITGGLSINSGTGAVTYVAGWSGTTVITATATGCNGPTTASHTVTVNGIVATPVFALGTSSVRCLGASTVNYSATATNATGISYSLDMLSLIAGNTINASTGDVNFSVLWVGSSTITATATGCGGPKSTTHSVTVTGAVAIPSFSSGSTSSRCQAANTVTYTATAANNSGITYSLDGSSLGGGNTINSSNGAVTYVAGWSGSSTITATATGCNGPKSSTHTVTTNPPVATPSFTSGSTSTRCQGSGPVVYAATASNATGITYTLDAASSSGGNTINGSTGSVNYAAGWSGTTTITATAAGCSGPTTATHVVTITPTVGSPSFGLGTTSTRCQGAGAITYSATSTNTTGITYSLNARASLVETASMLIQVKLLMQQDGVEQQLSLQVRRVAMDQELLHIRLPLHQPLVHQPLHQAQHPPVAREQDRLPMLQRLLIIQVSLIHWMQHLWRVAIQSMHPLVL